MSDLSVSLKALAPNAGAQLSVSSYFDEGLFASEQETIFRQGPRYVGHRLAVPEVGDYRTLAHEGEGRMLLHAPDGLRLLSNVCRHRQALMLRGRGRGLSNVVCPLHRWTYAMSGELAGAPHFDENPCLHLARWPLREWNGLLFEDNGRDVGADLAALDTAARPDFSGHVLDRTHVHECPYNWKTFVEVYLEDYHVGPFHPGLGRFVSCEDLRWQFGRRFSVQTVGVRDALERPGSAVYRRWHEAVLRLSGGVPPSFGAIWLTYFPSVMIEWYPNVMIVSSLYPRGPQRTINVVEFFYPEEIAEFEREFVEAQQAAYLETCAEDDEIALRMDAGRRALFDRGDDDAGPYQSPMEDGMRHFHAWYRESMVAPNGRR